MISLNSYEYIVLPNKIIYDPVAGMTIRQAMERALEMSNAKKKPVEVHMNDVIVTATDGADLYALLNEYFAKLDRRYVASAQQRQKAK